MCPFLLVSLGFDPVPFGFTRGGDVPVPFGSISFSPVTNLLHQASHPRRETTGWAAGGVSGWLQNECELGIRGAASGLWQALSPLDYLVFASVPRHETVGASRLSKHHSSSSRFQSHHPAARNDGCGERVVLIDGRRAKAAAGDPSPTTADGRDRRGRLRPLRAAVARGLGAQRHPGRATTPSVHICLRPGKRALGA